MQKNNSQKKNQYFKNTLSRDILVNVLYRFYLLETSDSEIIQYTLDNYPNLVIEWVNLLQSTLKKRIFIEEYINKFLINWSFNRLNAIEKAIFLLSVYEILFTTTNNKIIINEGINLMKVYSETKGYRLFNAVLDKINKNIIASKENQEIPNDK